MSSSNINIKMPKLQLWLIQELCILITPDAENDTFEIQIIFYNSLPVEEFPVFIMQTMWIKFDMIPRLKLASYL